MILLDSLNSATDKYSRLQNIEQVTDKVTLAKEHVFAQCLKKVVRSQVVRSMRIYLEMQIQLVLVCHNCQ